MVIIDANGNIKSIQSAGGHNILSSSHLDALAGNVARGDLIIGNSTPKWARVAVGAANSILFSNGTDPSWTTTPTIGGLLTLNAGLKIAGGNNIYPSADSTTAISIAQADGTTTFVVFDSSNKYVGIGTTPLTQLHATGEIFAAPATVTVAAGLGAGNISAAGSGSAINFFKRTLTSLSDVTTAGNRWAWYSPDGSSRLYTGTTGDVLNISSDGKFGIGIVPGYSLDVEGAAVGATWAKIGSSLGLYFIANQPNIGANLYYNGGWKFGKGSASGTNYGGVLNFTSTTGAWALYSTTATGNADAAATLTSALMTIAQSGAVTLIGALAMGSNKITGLANGTVASDAAAFGQIKTVIGTSYRTGVAGSSTEYMTFFNDSASALTDATSPGTTIPFAAVCRNLYFRTDSTQNAGGSLVVTIMKNGVATTLTATVAAGALAGKFSDTSNSFTVAAGDDVCVRMVNNAGVVSTRILALTMEVSQI